MTLPHKNASLTERFNSNKEKADCEDEECAQRARIQEGGGGAGRGRPPVTTKGAFRSLWKHLVHPNTERA